MLSWSLDLGFEPLGRRTVTQLERLVLVSQIRMAALVVVQMCGLEVWAWGFELQLSALQSDPLMFSVETTVLNDAAGE